jgi:hypothetical protein
LLQHCRLPPLHACLHTLTRSPLLLHRGCVYVCVCVCACACACVCVRARTRVCVRATRRLTHDNYACLAKQARAIVSLVAATTSAKHCATPAHAADAHCCQQRCALAHAGRRQSISWDLDARRVLTLFPRVNDSVASPFRARSTALATCVLSRVIMASVHRAPRRSRFPALAVRGVHCHTVFWWWWWWWWWW